MSVNEFPRNGHTACDIAEFILELIMTHFYRNSSGVNVSIVGILSSGAPLVIALIENV
jgi:hypothetical protein